VTERDFANVKVSIGGKEVTPFSHFVWVDTLKEPFYSWWMEQVKPSRNVILLDLKDEFTKEEYKAWKEKLLPKNPDEEVARLLPDVDPKKKLEDEGTNVP
jgi:hypothetical protein